MDVGKLSDREILVLIVNKVEHIDNDVSLLKKGFHSLRESHDNVKDTLYGDKDRGVTGMVSKVKDITQFVEEEKKFKFGIKMVGTVIGGIAGVLGLERLMKMFQ